jgi:hypothetical protein
LRNFTVSQNGNQLNVTDADGSQYRGLVATRDQAQAAYAFRVSGTNNTLRQPVVFTGQVLQVQTSVLRAETQQREAQKAKADNYTRYAAPIQNNFYDNNQVRVYGQATVGNAQIPVDAQNTVPTQNAAPAQK